MKRLVRMAMLASAAALMFVALAAGDNPSKAGDADGYFRKLDANMDNRLSKDEFLKIADKFRDKDRGQVRKKLEHTYDKLDPSHHGLTREQFRMFVEVRAKKRGEKAKNGK